MPPNYSIPPGGRPIGDAEAAVLEADMAEVVRSSHLFRSLDDDGRQKVLAGGYVCTFHRGDVLMRQGDAGDTMYLLLEGKVRVETDAGAGKLNLAELGRGACVGEVSVLKGSERTATVIAVGDVDCVAFQRQRILDLLEAYPRVKQLLESVIEGRARDTIDKIVGS